VDFFVETVDEVFDLEAFDLLELVLGHVLDFGVGELAQVALDVCGQAVAQDFVHFYLLELNLDAVLVRIDDHVRVRVD